MKNLYITYQAHTVVQHAQALLWFKYLRDLGYRVYSPVNHEADGVIDGRSIKTVNYEHDMAALRNADAVIVCVKGDDLTGAEFELGFLSALHEMGVRAPNLIVCDLKTVNPHPLGDLYIGSQTVRTAAVGGMLKYATRFESVMVLTDQLQQYTMKTEPVTA